MPAPESRYAVRSREVAAKVFEDEVVVVHLGSCTYYSASGSGADAWMWIEEGRPLAEVAATLAERYGIGLERARADVDRFAERLLEEGLVDLAVDAAASLPAPAPSSNGRDYAPPELHAYRDMADLLALDPPLPELDRPAWRTAGDDGRE